jgi:hypothetical protein
MIDNLIHKFLKWYVKRKIKKLESEILDYELYKDFYNTDNSEYNFIDTK